MEVISYRTHQRISSKDLDALIDESEDKKVIITVDNQYHYEIKRIE